MRTHTTTVLAAVLLSLAACGTGTTVGDDLPPEGGDVRTTSRALAAVVAEHTGRPSSATRDTDAAEELGKDGVGVELRYSNHDQQSDGDMLVVAVGTGLDESYLSCDRAPEWLAGCVEMDGGVVRWEGDAPEEDPGDVYVIEPKEKGAVLMFYAGPRILKDPRDLDLPISVDDLLAIAKDPRVDVTTSQAAVDAGEDLDYWRD